MLLGGARSLASFFQSFSHTRRWGYAVPGACPLASLYTHTHTHTHTSTATATAIHSRFHFRPLAHSHSPSSRRLLLLVSPSHLPVILSVEDAEADGAGGVDVGVEDDGREFDDRGFARVVVAEGDRYLVQTARPARLGGVGKRRESGEERGALGVEHGGKKTGWRRGVGGARWSRRT